MTSYRLSIVLDWIEQCFTCPSTQFRLYGRQLSIVTLL